MKTNDRCTIKNGKDYYVVADNEMHICMCVEKYDGRYIFLNSENKFPFNGRGQGWTKVFSSIEKAKKSCLRDIRKAQKYYKNKLDILNKKLEELNNESNNKI